MDEIDVKSGRPVEDVLHSKHPPESILEELKDMGVTPPLSHIDILQEIVEEVFKKMGEDLTQEVSMPPSYNYG